MELKFVGPILLPFIIEALKSFWEVFASEVERSASRSLIKMTVEGLKSAFIKTAISSDKSKVISDLEGAVRTISVRHHLDADLTQKLLDIVCNPNVLAIVAKPPDETKG